MKAGFKSPVKEKEQKDAELKPEAAKDTVVSDAPPQLPETATAAAVAEPATSSAAHTETTPAITEPAAETEAEKKDETLSTPNREKKTFLSGLSFINKRDRSVSPSAPKESTPKESKVEGAEIIEATKAAEAAKETPAATEAAETKAEEKAEESPVANKRQSVLGGLGRRASKMIQRVQPSKKENVTPAAAETKAEEPVVESAAPAVPAKNDVAPVETATSTEPLVENKPEIVNTSTPAPVAASA